MNSGVIYFSHGRSHLARLAVSLWTLRNVYSGSILILNGGNDDGIVHRIASDQRISAIVTPMPVQQRKRHTSYCAKPSLWRHTPYERNLFLDADTTVVRDPSSIFELLDQAPLVITKFSDWVTTGNIYSSRIRQWLDVDYGHAKELAQECLTKRYLAINTGVFAFNRANPDLQTWESYVQAGHKCSFTDELAMQILSPTMRHVLVDETWNASPIHHKCPSENVRIWHFHGGKNLRKEAGKALWWPVFEEVLRENIGGIQSWWKTDKTLRGIETVT